MSYHRTRPSHSDTHRIAEDIFPSPTMLQEYEYATSGAADKILQMAQEEQQRRLAREESQLLFYKKTVRIGQFFGFIAFMTILMQVGQLINNGYQHAAMLIFFGTLVVAFLTSVSFAFINRSALHTKTSTTKKTPASTNATPVASIAHGSSAQASNARNNTDSQQHRTRSHRNGNRLHRGNGNHQRRRKRTNHH